MQDQPNTKRCAKCREIKPTSEFHKCTNRHDGLWCYCRRCTSKNPKGFDEWWAKRKQLQADRDSGLKRCSKCKQTLPVSSFNRDSERSDGLYAYCKECVKPYARAAEQREREKREASKEKLPEGFKRCASCDDIKPEAEFFKQRRLTGKQAGYSNVRAFCIVCYNAYQKRLRLKDIQRSRAEQMRRYYAKHEQCRATRREWRRRIAARINASARAEYALCKALGIPFSTRRWEKNNRERYLVLKRAQSHRRRARKLSSGGSFTADEWEALLKKYQNRCVCCGIHAKDTPEGYLVADHVVPIASGGSSYIQNVQPLCNRDNIIKGARHSTDYRKMPFTGIGQARLIG